VKNGGTGDDHWSANNAGTGTVTQGNLSDSLDARSKALAELFLRLNMLVSVLSIKLMSAITLDV